MAILYKIKDILAVKKLQLPQTVLMALDVGQCFEVDVKFVDKRKMSDQQRKFIFALISYIGDELGYVSKFDKEYLRAILMEMNIRLHDIEKTSLKDYSMRDANKLIETIIEFTLENEIGIDGQIIEEYDYRFSSRQTYAMALKRICCVCGKRGADIHHMDQIGTKGNRMKVSHIGLRACPLCRKHHMEYHHNPKRFMDLYHIEPFVIDEKMELFIKKGKLREFEEDKNGREKNVYKKNNTI